MPGPEGPDRETRKTRKNGRGGKKHGRFDLVGTDFAGDPGAGAGDLFLLTGLLRDPGPSGALRGDSEGPGHDRKKDPCFHAKHGPFCPGGDYLLNIFLYSL